MREAGVVSRCFMQRALCFIPKGVTVIAPLVLGPRVLVFRMESPMGRNGIVLQALTTRQSTHPRLVSEPAPSEADLDTIFRAAMAAPDHGALRPWRFLVIEGAGLSKLGSLFAEAHHQREPDATEEALKSSEAKALRAPMIIAVYAHLRDTPKVPHEEQVIACGCAMQLMLLAAEALGYGATILTGLNMHSEAVHEGLGLASNERLVGLIYIGTPQSEQRRQKPRPEPSEFVRRWPPVA